MVFLTAAAFGLASCDDAQETPARAAGAKNLQRRAAPVIRIHELKGGVAGGAETYTVKHGTRVHVVITSDFRHVVHLLANGAKRVVKPGRPARFSFVVRGYWPTGIDSHVDPRTGRYRTIAKIKIRS